MKRVIGVLAVLVTLGATSAASGNFFYSKAGAQRVAKDYVYKHYGVSRFSLSTVCRPQGRYSADSRFKYHRWVCGWATPSVCGAVQIIGSTTGSGAYYGKVLRGARRC